MSELIKARESTLAELLRDGCFSVPIHQRYYDWEMEHVDALLYDLAEAVNEDSPCHFLGSIMLIKKGKNEWEINDGQQRIITFSLICTFLCKIFHDKKYSSGESSILRVLFDLSEAHGETLQNADSLSPRVTPPKNDKTNFNNLIRGYDVGTNGKMTTAWNNIASFFNDPEHQNFDWQKKALGFLLNKFIVIRLEVDRTLDANAIFETLNYRGKYLEQVDLIKNHFLSFFNSDTQHAKSDTMHDNFEKIYSSFNSKNVSEYVRCYMEAKYGFINKEKFFKETKRIFADHSSEKSNEIFGLVHDAAKEQRIGIFKTFLRRSTNKEFLKQLTIHARKSNSKRKIDDYLLDLHKYTITRPIVFTLFFSYSIAPEKDKRKMAKFVYNCTKVLSSFVQRVAHTGDFRPSVYEEKFANLAKDITGKSCNNANKFLERLKDCDKTGIINDATYIKQMEMQFYTKSSLTKSRYILEKIVEFQDNIQIADNQVSIEHVLPRSKTHLSKTNWMSQFSVNDHDRLVHCLGNLTLLLKTENSPTENDNESFTAKKKIYENSSYKLTKDICNFAKWSPDAIKRRQRKLATIAAKNIWHFEF